LEEKLKILDVRSLEIPEVKVICFARFQDHRGYFTEVFRKSDFRDHPLMSFMQDVEFAQCNESYSKTGTVRGLHFQWNPYMGKLVRTVVGHMVDLVLDIRKGAPTFGKIIAHDMPSHLDANVGEWIWVPPGFAHGNFFRAETCIEYYCSGPYNPQCESGISPFAPDLDWSYCDPRLRELFDATAAAIPVITEKDRNGHTLASWLQNPNSEKFAYKEKP
jgi:dTDP-4-dehydrorhamnose 3,5-epimerase